MPTGRTTRNEVVSRPFRAAAYLRDEKDIASYLEAILEDGNPRLNTLAAVLRAVGLRLAVAPAQKPDRSPRSRAAA